MGEGMHQGGVPHVDGLRFRSRWNLVVKAGDHQSRAADLLGISERMLRYKLKKYGLKAG